MTAPGGADAPPPPRVRGALVVASHNPDKLAEICALLAPYDVQPLGAAELGLSAPEETGDSFSANAQLKAQACVRASGLPALGDDSGLAVAALDGAPGIYSARWGGPGRDFGRAMARVQEALDARSAGNRRGCFVCALALARPGAQAQVFTGRVRGVLVWPPRGAQGFGYDPMFVPDGHVRTFGQMPAAEKFAISHRARAFAQFRQVCLVRR